MLCFIGQAPTKNRSGLIAQADLTRADGHAERRARTGAYHSADFVRDLRQACVTPQFARNSRHSAIDGRTTRHAGRALSRKHRARIAEPSGWGKTISGLA